jgi:hypothetical protein
MAAIGSARQSKKQKTRRENEKVDWHLLEPGHLLLDLGRREEEVAAPSHLVFRHALRAVVQSWNPLLAG